MTGIISNIYDPCVLDNAYAKADGIRTHYNSAATICTAIIQDLTKHDPHTTQEIVADFVGGDSLRKFVKNIYADTLLFPKYSCDESLGEHIEHGLRAACLRECCKDHLTKEEKDALSNIWSELQKSNLCKLPEQDRESLGAWYDPSCEIDVLLNELLSKEAGPRYEVLFPCVFKHENDKETIPGLLCWARITLLKGGTKNKVATSFPNVRLAPWTSFGLSYADLKKLRQLLKPHLDCYLSEQYNAGVLLDIERASPGPNDTIAPSHVRGQSLGLAVWLALWAAFKQRNLVPIVATGHLTQNDAVDSVEDVPTKYETAWYYVQQTSAAYQFVYHGERPLVEHDRLKLRGVDRLSTLTKEGLLTDGFDAYRQYFMHRTDDIEESTDDEHQWEVCRIRRSTLTEIVDEYFPMRLDDLQHSPYVMVAPFGERTEEYARHVLTCMVQQIVRKAGPKNRSFPIDYPVPLPLSLAYLEKSTLCADVIPRLVEKTLEHWEVKTLCGSQVLQNVLHHFLSKQFIMVYGVDSQTSWKHDYFVRNVLRSLKAYCSLGAYATFIASDSHHAKFCLHTLQTV